MADTSNILLKSLVSGNDKLPFSTLGGLAGAANSDDQAASNLSGIADGIQPNSILAALVKGATSGVAMTKKEKAQAQRDQLNQRIQQLTEWDVSNKQHQQEMEDLVQSQVYSRAKQGAFVDGLNAVSLGGDPQPLIDVMNGDAAMSRTVARQFGVDPTSKLVDLQVTKDRNGQEHLIGSFTDAQGQKFTAPTQIEAAKVMSAVAQPLLDQRAAEASAAALEQRKTLAGIAKDEAGAAKDLADANGPQGSGGQKAPSGYQYKNDGTMEAIPGGPGDKSTLEQSNAAMFSNRLVESNKIIKGLTEQGYKPGIMQDAVQAVPLVGNFMNSGDTQSFIQAKRDFVNAILRRESGAAISPAEFDNANKQYFPMPGDKPETLAQKERNRDTVIKGLIKASGPAGRDIQYGSDVLTPPALNPATDATPTSPNTLPQPNLDAIDAELRRRGKLK